MSDTADDDVETATGDEGGGGPTMELTAAQQVDMQMRHMLAMALGENIAGGDTGDLPDYYDIFDWDPNPSTRDFYALALRNPYAFAVTFLPASTSWRDPPKIVDDAEADNDDNQTDFESDVEDVVREHDLWDYTKRADKLAGIGNFGVLVLEFDDIEDPGDFDQEISPNEDLNLTGLKPFSRLSIQGVELGGPGSGRWGEPEYYQIDLRDENDEEFAIRQTSDSLETSQGGPKTLRVHHSRVIHIHSDELLDDEIRGIPRQQPVYNNLVDIERALGSAGQLAYRASAWGININIDKDYNVEENGDELREALHRWEVGLENVLRTHGADEVQSLGGEEIDPSKIIDPNIEAICSQPYMPPQSVLKGNETGERATTEDLKHWYGEIQERRETFITPTIVRRLIDRLVELNIVDAPDEGPMSYSVEWKPLAELSEKEIAQNQNTRAETLAALINLGLDREQMLEYLRDGSLPSEIQSVAEDVVEMEDVEAIASSARGVEEITAGYEAVADGGEANGDTQS